MNHAAHHINDTIVAIATPSGVGAIAVIRVSGNEAIQLINGIFDGKDLTKQPTHTIHYGNIKEEDRLIDEVLVSLFIAPKSYTGEDSVEISCHGSDYIVQEILQLIINKGARLAQPGEFTMRAFLNGKMDLSQAEAVADLIASSTEAAHQVALRQLRGGFSNEIQNLRQELIDFASLIELELDFGEEDVEFADRDKLKALVRKIQGLIRSLLRSFQLGNALKNGVQTVIAGRPNAGKSTLLNALLNEERAIVSDIAGTTRDTIEELLNINGIAFRLIDTAGIREAKDQIEAIGVEKTMEKIQQSSILVYVFDVLRTSPEEVRKDLAQLMRPNQHLLIVANKMDLNPYTKYTDFFPQERKMPDPDDEYQDRSRLEMPDTMLGTEKKTIGKSSWVPISAINKMNIEYLKEKLYNAVVEESIDPSSTVVSNIRHFEALQKANESLDAVLRGLEQGITSDFVALDIRQALHHLGEITGEVTTDDLLGNIFGKFCIGK